MGTDRGVVIAYKVYVTTCRLEKTNSFIREKCVKKICWDIFSSKETRRSPVSCLRCIVYLVVSLQARQILEREFNNLIAQGRDHRTNEVTFFIIFQFKSCLSCTTGLILLTRISHNKNLNSILTQKLLKIFSKIFERK